MKNETDYGSFSRPSLKRVERHGASAAWYLWFLLALPLVLTPLLILAGKSDFFLHHGASAWVQANDAVFDQRNRDCKVLIFGDSTAMTGIDPVLVQQETGLPTCNISVTNAVLSVTGQLSLNSYLTRNPHPEVLVVQLSPEGFQKTSTIWENTVYPEGLLELLRHTPLKQSAIFFLHHPQQAFAFAGYVAGFGAWYAIRQAVHRATGVSFETDRAMVRNGFFTPPVAARHSCESFASASPLAQGADRQVAETYRSLFRSGTVLVNVAPIPNCDRNLSHYQEEFAGLTSNRLESLPIRYFNDERHFTADGSRILSRVIAEQVTSAIASTKPQRQVTLTSLNALQNSSRSPREQASALVQ